MTPEQFLYWLQGFAELSGDAAPTPEQWKSIREHLATCFNKVTPPVQVSNRVKIGPAVAEPATHPADAWPPRDYTGVPPHWLEGGKVTITC